jgi:acyl-coenzyme A synthetase/AMP-(fatty) acid ligase
MRESYISVEQLLFVRRSRQWPVAVRADQSIMRWGQWQDQVCRWFHVFSKQRHQRWALYCDSSLDFSILLFALLHSGKTVVLAGNTQQGTHRQLDNLVDAFVGDFHADWVSKPVLKVSEADQQGGKPVEWDPIDVDKESITIFTSGSSGDPVTITKSLAQLSREVHTLHNLWGHQIEDAVFISTVSHQHIYGILFKVLWPLAAGNVFLAGTCHYGEDIFLGIKRNPATVLVSSPSHLMRLPTALHWPEIHDQLRLAFTSTAPISYNEAVIVKKHLGQLPTEVFGSSETGGIAWRQQIRQDQPWAVLPGIKIRTGADGQRLELQSPHLSSMAWQSGDDNIELLGENKFVLRGRTDTIAKVEGKRISLSEIEKKLLTQPFVTQARVIKMRSKRDYTAAVVALTDDGISALKAKGKHHFNQILVQHMRDDLESVVIPKRFRYVSNMPANQQGKITVPILEGLIGDEYHKGKLPTLVLLEQTQELSWRLTLEIPAGLSFFSGHFPNRPILPGVAMIFWTEYYANLLFEINGSFSSLRRSKFQQVVRPDNIVLASLTYQPDKNAVYYSFESLTGTHASGQMRFGH